MSPPPTSPPGRDFTTLRSVLADDVSFRGPVASLDGADSAIQGLEQMVRILTDAVTHKTFVDRPD